MRIAEIAPPFAAVPPVGYGGTEAVVDTLARGFKAAGHEVLLVTVPSSTCPVPKYEASPDVDLSRMNWTEIELRHVIRAYERVKHFDIVHDHTNLGPIYSERYKNLRVVTTQHHPNNENFYDIFRASGHRVPMVAISHDQARKSRDFGIERVIYHGIDPALFEFNANPSDYFVFLGRMAPSKGIHHAIKAAQIAGVKLKIAGPIKDSEGEREYFESEVKPHLNDQIEYVGQVTGLAKTELLANAKAMLNPLCWDEPFGLVMIEAMACGTPVIAFGNGSVPEIVDHGVTGFVCNNAEEMAKYIGQLRLIRREDCRALVEGHFSSQRMVADYLDFFQELLDRDAATQPASQFLDLTFKCKQLAFGERPAGAIGDRPNGALGETTNPSRLNPFELLDE